MKITLKNGEEINLEWNAVVLEYLEDYEGGIEQLKQDIETKKHNFKTFNFVIFCMLSAVYPSELRYREAVGLVNINDYDKIITFVVENVNNTTVNNNDNTERKLSIYHRR